MREYEKIRFGNYKGSSIIWRILKKDMDSLLLLSEYALDNKCFHDQFTKITWEHCSLRKWLNNEFITEAFSDDEKDMILPVEHGREKYIDYAFCLNITECLKFLPDEEDRICYSSEYVRSKEDYKVNWDYFEGRCIWWLRSMGCRFENYAVYVERHGELNPYSSECIGAEVIDDYLLVRPAIKIIR